jgi:hypothetical protein
MITITTTRAQRRMPSSMTLCTDPRTIKDIVHYCSENPDLTTQLSCPEAWTPKPPLLFSTCPSYQYFSFEPVALAGARADAYALSEIRFFYQNRPVLPAAVRPRARAHTHTHTHTVCECVCARAHTHIHTHTHTHILVGEQVWDHPSSRSIQLCV